MKVLVLVMTQILSGVLLTITAKYMYKQKEGEVQFNQVYLQCMLSFLGQTFNFVIYYIQQQQQQKQKEQQERLSEYEELDKHKTSSKAKLLARLLLPAIFHLTCQMCGFAAFLNINASLAMMIGSSLPVITALLHRVIFKTSIKTHQMQGMVTILLGTLIINSYTLLFGQSDHETNTNLAGLIFSNLSVLLFAGLIISEEVCLKVYQLDSSLIAGTEGGLAFVLSLVSIPVVNSCWHNLVDLQQFYSFVTNSSTFRYTCVILLMADMIYTLMCILVTKHLDGLARAIIYQLRIVGVWVVTLFLDNPQYLGGGKWEVFSFIQLIGYLLLLLGVFIFNNIISLQSFIKNDNVQIQHSQYRPPNIELTPRIK